MAAVAAAAAVTRIPLSEFWERVAAGSKTAWTRQVEFVLNTFGTSLSCNRFAVGEVIEKCTCAYLNSVGIQAVDVPSAKRYDTRIENVEGLETLSLKFVSTDGEVTLHNSQRKTNTDMTMIPTLLFRLKDWWFLHPPTIAALGVDVCAFMKNTGDSLQLSFKLLSVLAEKGYPYHVEHALRYDKEACSKKATSDLLYLYVCDMLSDETPAEKRAYLEAYDRAIPSRNDAEERAAAKAAKAAARAEARAAGDARKALPPPAASDAPRTE
jgi:hypothetical protein